jgi:hypothetical protein
METPAHTTASFSVAKAIDSINMDPHDWSMWNSIILRAFDEPVAEQLADRRRKVWSVDAR